MTTSSARGARLIRRLAAATAVSAMAVSLAACAPAEDSASSGSDDLTDVRMIQEWPVADGFWIPWVVGVEKGFYEDAGIDLEIITPPNTAATMQFLGTDQADLAFTTSVDILTAKSQDVPVVGVARYGSENNWGLFSEGDTALTAADLKGKTIGTYNDAWSNAQLSIMLASAGLSLSDVTLVTADSSTVPLLVEGKVDAITGITNAEGSELESLGFTDYSVAYSKDFGAPDAPVLMLAANTDWLDENTDVAQKFMAATLEGLNYARNNPEEAVQIFMDTYPDAQSEEFTTLQWTATAALFGDAGTDVTMSGLEQSEESWQSIVDAATEFDVIDDPQPATDYFTNKALN